MNFNFFREIKSKPIISEKSNILGQKKIPRPAYSDIQTNGSKTLHTLLIKYYINCLHGQSYGSLLVNGDCFLQDYKLITEPIFKNFQENGALKKLFQ